MQQRSYEPRNNSRGYRKFNNNSRGYSNSFAPKRNFKSAYMADSMFIAQASDTDVISQSVYDETITFNNFNLHAKVKDNIFKNKYKHPTKIQSSVIEHILNGKDVMGLASTGSGKTAAFLIPMINACIEDSSKKCLILAPTRELVNQIQSEFQKFSAGTNVRDVLIVGGASYTTQIRLIRRNPQFVIATPGRLLDLCNGRNLDLSSFDHVVLDEVDCMLDMGFIHDIKTIISMLKRPRQSLFFSATMNQKLHEIATVMLTNPQIVEVAKQEASKNVEQNIVRVDSSQNKLDVLHDLLIKTEFTKVLVFARTKRYADKVSDSLAKRGHKCDALHGNKTLNARTRVLSKFKNSEIKILVATDVASRGIDVPDISHVINFDKPDTYEEYIHRIGRTGRIGKKGIALTFV